MSALNNLRKDLLGNVIFNKCKSSGVSESDLQSRYEDLVEEKVLSHTSLEDLVQLLKLNVGSKNLMNCLDEGESFEEEEKGCRLNVILDIDETFLYFINKRYWDHSWDTLSNKEKNKYQTIPTKTGVFIKRPHLDEFTDWLFKNCNVAIWTWSDKEYAEGFPTEALINDRPERKLEFVYCDEQAAESQELHGFSKDLNYLWYGKNKSTCFAPCNTILIDDLPNNTITASNHQNCITLKPFALFGEVKDRSDPYEDVSEDDTLLRVLEILKKAKKIAQNCYEDEDLKEVSIFTPENIRRAGIDDKYVHTALIKKGKGKKEVEFIGINPVTKYKTSH